MKQVEVKYAPGMRIIVRGEEWLVKKVETNSLGNQTLHVIGLSQLVKESCLRLVLKSHFFLRQLLVSKVLMRELENLKKNIRMVICQT